MQISEIGEPHYDDPSLALLFSQLRSKTLQAAKGTSEISGRAEFNFVLQMSRVFCRMGKCCFACSEFKCIDFP
jgi:RAVE protein 1 C terminal